MFSLRWKKMINKEAFLVSLGLFIILGIAESIRPYVVIRNPKELSLILFYYLLFYLITISVRTFIWAIGNLIGDILPHVQQK